MMKRDITRLKTLCSHYAEIASKPFNKMLKRQWQKINALKPERPMYIIDEVPWHELNQEGELTLLCKDPTCRLIEQDLLRLLYRYHHFQDDYVFEPYLYVPKKIIGVDFDPATGIALDYGLAISQNTIETHPESLIVAHEYIDQLETEEDLNKLRVPDIKLDEEVTKKREEVAHAAADGILEVRMDGFTPWFAAWDYIVEWRGVEKVMIGMYDEPELLHKTIQKVLNISLECLDQLEKKGLLSYPQRQIHCCGAWSDELPAPGYVEGYSRAVDLWTYGMAQILYTASPEQHNEYEFEYAKHWYSRFGLGYYGCCEPLEDRLEYVKKIPSIRKISTSAWVKDYERFSEQLEGKYVMSFKPTPADLVDSAWDQQHIEEKLKNLLSAANRYGTPCEFTLKDISTVDFHPERITQWSKIMRDAIGS